MRLQTQSQAHKCDNRPPGAHVRQPACGGSYPQKHFVHFFPSTAPNFAFRAGFVTEPVVKKVQIETVAGRSTRCSIPRCVLSTRIVLRVVGCFGCVSSSCSSTVAGWAVGTLTEDVNVGRCPSFAGFHPDLIASATVFRVNSSVTHESVSYFRGILDPFSQCPSISNAASVIMP